MVFVPLGSVYIFASPCPYFKYSNVRISNSRGQEIPKLEERQVAPYQHAANRLDLSLVTAEAEQNIVRTVPRPLSSIDIIIRLKSIHLEWLGIRKIENLEVFTDLSVLYLQHVLHLSP